MYKDNKNITEYSYSDDAGDAKATVYHLFPGVEVAYMSNRQLYITNVVKIRPTKVSDKGRVSNRPPSREELALFTPFLMEEILLVQPRLIVTLGNVPLRALMGAKAVIGSVHGEMQRVSVAHEKQSADFALFPLYHPASIIYNRSLQEVYQADLMTLKAALADG